MVVQSPRELVWCQGCRQEVTPANLRPWPGGTLVIGECPNCHTALAARKPIEWDSAEQSVRTKEAEQQRAATTF